MGDNTAETPLRSGRPEWRYANYFEVGSNQHEIVIRFAQCYEGDLAIPHTIVTTNPAAARSLLKLLTEALDEHWRRFGGIAT